jgi:hypothetical protein
MAGIRKKREEPSATVNKIRKQERAKRNEERLFASL